MRKEAMEGLDKYLEFMESPRDAVNHLIEIGVLMDDVVLSPPKLEDDCPECDGVGVKADSLPCCQECGGSGKRDLTPLRERLAEYAHISWSDWMGHLFRLSVSAKSTPQLPDGREIIPAYCVKRWKRQMGTEYQDLPEEEKSSDRDQADKILGILKGEI